ncbi:MAG: pentapeptide repeat-containing protein [Calothrix sp. FI2-JRJ7]|nr:pentapeptide repeat-containing protein [Calothrix sp. FI2-JRJ7]
MLSFHHISNANLNDANLNGANLEGTDLTDVKNLTLEQVKVAQNWEKAKFNSELGLVAEIT